MSAIYKSIGEVPASELKSGMILKEPTNPFLFVSINHIVYTEPIGMYFMEVEYFGTGLTQSYYINEGESVEVFGELK